MLLFFRNSEKEEYSSYIRSHPFPDTKENITKSTRKLEIIVGNINFTAVLIFRSSRPEFFLGKCVLKICIKFTGDHNTYCRSAISNLTSAWVFSCNFAAYFQNNLKAPLDGCFWVLHIFFYIFFLYSIETPTLIFKVISQKLGGTWRHLCWPTPYQLPSPFWRKTGLYWYKKKYRYTGHSLPMLPFCRRPKSSWRFLKYLTSLTFYYCIPATHKSVISFHLPDHRFMELESDDQRL